MKTTLLTEVMIYQEWYIKENLEKALGCVSGSNYNR